MNLALRSLAFLPETLVFGVSYGVIRFLIRSDKPLDADWTWNYITGRLPPVPDWIRFNYPPQFWRWILLRTYLRPPHHVGIEKHYDVSNDFYELFLDKKYMFYTCADYRTGRETLEEAQDNKVQFILNLVDPKPGEKILELGCGWGGMLEEIARRTGDRDSLAGYTLSKNQVEYNRTHRGLNVELKNFITTDYPTVHYDKIYSVGAWEHVRKADLRPLLEKLYHTLKPGGKVVTHFFTGLGRGIPMAGILGQIFFPGSAMPPYHIQLRTAQDVGFRVMHQSVHDTYRETLRHWFERLVANRDRAIELVGIPTYNKYVMFFPCSWKYFDDVQGMLLRIVLQKPPIA